MPEENPIEILFDEDTHFVVDDHIVQGIGTSFDRVELMQLSQFSAFDESNRIIYVIPESEAHVGEYPFIVRVFDSNNNPKSQQFIIKVTMPVQEVVELVEDEIVIDGLDGTVTTTS